MSDETPRRRESFIAGSAPYAAIGASLEPDIARFAPEHTTAFAYRRELGSGDELAERSIDALMSLSAFRHAGFRVAQVASQDPLAYQAAETEARFSASGDPYLAPGMTVELQRSTRSPKRTWHVVTVREVERGSGVALGTADTLGVVGECYLAIETHGDGTVVASARGFFGAPDQENTTHSAVQAWWRLWSARASVRRLLRAIAAQSTQGSR